MSSSKIDKVVVEAVADSQYGQQYELYVQNGIIVEFVLRAKHKKQDWEYIYTGKWENHAWHFYGGSRSYSLLPPRIVYEFQQKGIDVVDETIMAASLKSV